MGVVALLYGLATLDGVVPQVKKNLALRLSNLISLPSLAIHSISKVLTLIRVVLTSITEH